jgi:hypothetical protein
MNEQNLDINLIVQAFQEKVSQLITELVVKEAAIKQLTMQLAQPQAPVDEFETPTNPNEKVK